MLRLIIRGSVTQYLGHAKLAGALGIHTVKLSVRLLLLLLLFRSRRFSLAPRETRHSCLAVAHL